jgi:methionyl-tRNA formyltransferase
VADGGGDGGARIAVCAVEPHAWHIVAAWAARHGHRVVLVVTTPGPPHTWDRPIHRELLAALPPRQDVLVSSRLRTVAAPALAALATDLLLSFTFPHRLPPALTGAARCGAVNLHPTPLPRYRGPNPRRMVYDGAPTIGATLHYVDAGFDTGPILSRHEAPVPSDASSEALLAAWTELLDAALEEGVPRALAGEPGMPQDETEASYAAPFSETERRLNWAEPAATIGRRVTALNLFHPEAWATIEGQRLRIHAVRPSSLPAGGAPPGTVLCREGEVVTVVVADGAVEAVASLEEARARAQSEGSDVPNCQSA